MPISHSYTPEHVHGEIFNFSHVHSLNEVNVVKYFVLTLFQVLLQVCHISNVHVSLDVQCFSCVQFASKLFTAEDDIAGRDTQHYALRDGATDPPDAGMPSSNASIYFGHFCRLHG